MTESHCTPSNEDIHILLENMEMLWLNFVWGKIEILKSFMQKIEKFHLLCIFLEFLQILHIFLKKNFYVCFTNI